MYTNDIDIIGGTENILRMFLKQGVNKWACKKIVNGNKKYNRSEQNKYKKIEKKQTYMFLCSQVNKSHDIKPVAALG